MNKFSSFVSKHKLGSIAVALFLGLSMLVGGFVFLAQTNGAFCDNTQKAIVKNEINADSADRYYLHGSVGNSVFTSNQVNPGQSLAGWTYASGVGYATYYAKIYNISVTVTNESDSSYAEVKVNGPNGYMRWTANEGYAFAYWTGDGLSASTPYYPVFAQRRTVNFYMYQGDNSNTVYKTVYIGDGGSISRPNNPSRNGYTFYGWGYYSSSTHQGEIWTTGTVTISQKQDFYAMWKEDMNRNLWAIWSENCTSSTSGSGVSQPYYNTYVAQGSQSWSINITQNSDSSIVSATCGSFNIQYIANSGYAFADWQYQFNYYSKVGVKAPVFATRRTVNFYYNATDTTSIYTTKYIGNGGSMSLPNAPERYGYTFDGWAKTSAGDVEWSSGTMVIAPGYCEWYAKWTYNDTGEVPVIETYTVTFGANGGTGTMQSISGINGEYVLPQCTFTAPQGKEFYGWSVNGVRHNVGDSIEISSNTNVVALWKTVGNEQHEQTGTQPQESKKLSSSVVVGIIAVSAVIVCIGAFYVIKYVNKKKKD